MKKVTTKFELNSTDLSTQIRPSFFFQNFSSLIAFRTMRFSIHFCFMWKKYFKKILSFLLEFCWLIWNFLQIVHSTFPQVAQFKILIVLNLFFCAWNKKISCLNVLWESFFCLYHDFQNVKKVYDFQLALWKKISFVKSN